jgi:hypothetical protein
VKLPRGVKAAGQLTADQAKEGFLKGIAEGLTNREAIAKVQRTEKTIEYWRKTDQAFKDRADQARALAKDRSAGKTDLRDIDFADFSERYLGHRPYWHHLQWIDVLEGREPREVHPAQIYEKASPQRLLVNTPPHHGKTATITINYVVYRICMDPNVRIKLVSKNEKMAKQFLFAIKNRLTHPRFTALQAAFAPQGGWKETAEKWSATELYLGGDDRDSGEKDPTVEALGMGGHIYGSRANLIILDDCIVGSNAHQWEDQMGWISREVTSRLGRTGKLLVVGTRIAPVDLYRELRNPDHYSGGKSPYTYLQQPAVLEYEDDPANWRTLWPKSSSPIESGSAEEEPDEDGMYAAWDGPSLYEVRQAKSASDWALVYMQADVADEATFPEHAVKGAVNGMRRQGPLVAGAVGHPERGQDGLYVIASMDPSGSGDTAFVAVAIDRESRKRYVLNATTIPMWSWPKVTEIVQTWTEQLDIREWVVEKNMYHSTFRQNETLATWLASKGVRTKEHYTGSQKQDVDLGVASLAPLFGEWHKPTGRWENLVEPLIELPSTHKGEGIKKLIEQLVTWSPATKNKTDLVMALWFADLRARELVTAKSGRYSKSHLDNPYLSEYRRSQRRVISLTDYRTATG